MEKRARPRESESTNLFVELGRFRAVLVRLAAQDAAGTRLPPSMAKTLRRLIAREDLRRRTRLRESPERRRD